MAELTSKANLGDIIRSERFAYGVFDYSRNGEGHYVIDRSRVAVDGINQGYTVVYRDPADSSKFIQIDATAHDESRRGALFVVEKAEMRDQRQRDGSLTGEWYVEARRLNADGPDNGESEIIYFYQGGMFRNRIPEVEVIKK